MSHLSCCIDIGTTSVKIGIIEPAGTMIAFEKIEYPRGSIAWQDLSFFKLFSDHLADIGYVAISAQSPSIVPILLTGGAGTAVFYYEKLNNLSPKGSYSVFLPKVAYHKEHYPNEYEQTFKYVSLGDYLVYLLTGHIVTSLPRKIYEQAVWTAQEILEYELDAEKFPPQAIWPDIVGVTQEGLCCPAGIKVLASNYDFLSAILGLDALDMNIASDRGGGSMGLNFFFEAAQMTRVQNQRPLKELEWSIYPHLRDQCFNAGLIFPDFDNFMTLIKKELQIQPQTRLDLVLNPILMPLMNTMSSIEKNPQSLSFLQMWKQSEKNTPLERAQDVFMQYAQILKIALRDWPVSPIEEVRASGGPNESTIFTQFKESITKIPWKTSAVIHAELLGNFYAIKSHFG